MHTGKWETWGLLALFVLALAPGSAFGAEDQTLSTVIDGVEINLWLPGNVPQLRGVVVNPADKNVGAGVWSATCRNLGFAQMGLLIDRSRSNRPRILDAAMNAALAKFATEANHPELTRVPLAFAGMSAGGGWSASLAYMEPARAIAYANVCCWVTKPEELDETKMNIPGLQLIGAVPDGFKLLDEIPAKIVPARAKGARWSLALQWGAAHNWNNANALVMPYLQTMVGLRVPATAAAAEGPVALKPLQFEDGWLGDPDTCEGNYATIAPWAEYKGDKSKATWWPTRYLAYGWRAFVSKDPAVTLDAGTTDGKITMPNGNKRDMVVPVGQAVTLKATVAEGTTIAGATFYDGDRVIGEAKKAPWTITWKQPAAGAHVVYVEWRTADGNKGVSNPACIAIN